MKRGWPRTPGQRKSRDLPGIAAAVGSLCSRGTIVVLDEFQVCHRGPLSGFPSLLQEQVDRLQDRNAAGGLIVLGSVQADMEALLHDRRAPLFGRTTFELTLGPWNLTTIFEVCRAHGADDPARCLTLWTLFGGVPKYWRHFAETDGLDTVPEWEPWTQQVCERLFLRSGSPLREEGEGLLARELRRNYLAILRTLAERPSCTHAELQDALPELSLGPYLSAVTNDLRLVERKLPIFAGQRQRRARYTISDQFLCAWLRVMQPACQAARILPAPRVAQRALAALRTLEGHAFERMVRGSHRGGVPRRRSGLSDYRSHCRLLEPATDTTRTPWRLISSPGTRNNGACASDRASAIPSATMQHRCAAFAIMSIVSWQRPSASVSPGGSTSSRCLRRGSPGNSVRAWRRTNGCAAISSTSSAC